MDGEAKTTKKKPREEVKSCCTISNTYLLSSVPLPFRDFHNHCEARSRSYFHESSSSRLLPPGFAQNKSSPPPYLPSGNNVRAPITSLRCLRWGCFSLSRSVALACCGNAANWTISPPVPVQPVAASSNSVVVNQERLRAERAR